MIQSLTYNTDYTRVVEKSIYTNTVVITNVKNKEYPEFSKIVIHFTIKTERSIQKRKIIIQQSITTKLINEVFQHNILMECLKDYSLSSIKIDALVYGKDPDQIFTINLVFNHKENTKILMTAEIRGQINEMNYTFLSISDTIQKEFIRRNSHEKKGILPYLGWA